MADVEFSEGGTRLYGSLRVPPGGSDCPGLVFLHGSGPATHADWTAEAEKFAAAGIASLAYDKPGSGRSEGDWTAQTFGDRAREALAALWFLKEQPGVDVTRVGLLGMSQGAWVAPMVAADSEEVAFVIALSASGTGPREQDRFRLERQLVSEGFARPEIEEALLVWLERDERLRSEECVESLVGMQLAYAHRRWYPYLAFDDPSLLRFVRRIWSFDPLPYVERCRCPVLGVWGEDDVFVAAVESRKLFDEALAKGGNAQHKLVLIPGLGHGLGAEENGRMHPDVLKLMTRWVMSVS
jgi:uncharacterized protein